MSEYGALRIKAMLLGDADAYRELMTKMSEQDRLAEVDRLRGLLARLEWAGWADAPVDACPACMENRSRGHTPDCWLAAELHPERKEDAAP